MQKFRAIIFQSCLAPLEMPIYRLEFGLWRAALSGRQASVYPAFSLRHKCRTTSGAVRCPGFSRNWRFSTIPRLLLRRKAGLPAFQCKPRPVGQAGVWCL